MNNEQQTYVLKRPINAWPNFDSNEMVVELENDDYRCSLEAFNEDFVPLDVSGLTRQVEELLQNYGARFFADYEIDRIAYKENIEAQEAGGRMESRARKEFAEQIVLLLLNQEGDTK